MNMYTNGPDIVPNVVILIDEKSCWDTVSALSGVRGMEGVARMAVYDLNDRMKRC